MSTEADDRVITLVQTLLERTRTGKLEWEDQGRESYAVRRRSGTSIVRSVDADGASPFEFVLYDARGVPVDKVHSNQGTQWKQYLSDLFVVARRNALKTDEVFDSFMDELDEQPPPLEDDFPPAGPDDDIPF